MIGKALARLHPAGAFVVNHWRLIGLGILLAALAVQTWRLDSAKKTGAANLAACELRNASQVAEWQAQYNRAVETAMAAKAEREAQHEKARKQAASSYASLSDQYRAAVLRLKARTYPGGTQSADLREGTDAAGLPADAATGAVVSVRIEDVEICASTTAYAQAAHEWAISLGDE